MAFHVTCRPFELKKMRTTAAYECFEASYRESKPSLVPDHVACGEDSGMPIFHDFQVCSGTHGFLSDHQNHALL